METKKGSTPKQRQMISKKFSALRMFGVISSYKDCSEDCDKMLSR